VRKRKLDGRVVDGLCPLNQSFNKNIHANMRSGTSIGHVGTCDVHVVLLRRLPSTKDVKGSNQNYEANSQL
jgi:hypothetical protein